MSFNPSVLGQGFLEGERARERGREREGEREGEALPGYKIKTANVLITIFSPGAADDKIRYSEKLLLL